MAQKLKKSKIYLILSIILFGTIISCQKQTEEVIPVDKETLTQEQRQFLVELDEIIAQEIEKNKKYDPNAKGGNIIDPSNPNNPYEYVGNQTIGIFECIKPHYAEISYDDIIHCPQKDQTNCGKTGECICYGAEENLKKLYNVCAFEITGVYSTYPTQSELLNANLGSLTQAGQNIIIKYISTVKKLNNASSIVSLSRGFENKISTFSGLSSSDQKRITPIITSLKYSIAYISNIGSNSDNPLEWPTLDGTLDCLGSDEMLPVLVIGAATGNGWILAGAIIGCSLA